MIIKKFVANTEQEAVMMAKEEMGSNAVVLNIKTTKQRGFKRLFKKDTVEITAALEDKTTSSIPVSKINIAVDDNTEKEEKKPTAIEEKLDNLQSILESRMANSEEKELDNVKTEKNVNFKFIQLIYNQLLENEVDEKYINQIISEIESSLKKESNLDTILALVYQKIVLKLGSPVEISLEDKKTKVAFFVGPTGVGKTTTIAKIASMFKLDKEAKVAMITSDTYRIAAVEQLRTYANILDVPLQVVYTLDELNDAIDKFKEYDLILIDTAGRSHKNEEQCMEMLHFVNDCVIPEDCTKEVFIVLSASTKYKDLENIIDVYGEIGDYNLIFTKLDETSAFGNILNIKLKTGVNLSYVTSGQVVPDDISLIDAQKMAKSLLGGGK
ncbi:MAG: flagellar biosynthesis protein FlhF [Clostridiales bacterium]|nr:flagellar biosynthesis protein FlhF [Clostridiales bacterium]MDD6294210.1 flagellar biosynthesis protein FlhF [Eubacteriales bacterium]